MLSFLPVIMFLVMGGFVVNRAYSGVKNTYPTDELHKMHVKNFQQSVITYVGVTGIILILSLMGVFG